MVGRFLKQNPEQDILFSQEGAGRGTFAPFKAEASVYRLKDAPAGSDEQRLRDTLARAIAALADLWRRVGLIKPGSELTPWVADMVARMEAAIANKQEYQVGAERRGASTIA